jgi:hypothetical protein
MSGRQNLCRMERNGLSFNQFDADIWYRPAGADVVVRKIVSECLAREVAWDN